jgi:aarF domain-containing kinase
MLRRSIIFIPPIVGAGLAAATVNSDQFNSQPLFFATALPIRLARDISFAATTFADYQWSLSLKELHQNPSLREDIKKQCHQRGAHRLVKLCFSNGGIYIKLGQHIGMLDHLLPDEYVLTARKHMLDKCPVSAIEDVVKTIEDDLGKPMEELFTFFDETPLASASLAQVHRAIDPNGRPLAVKIQHRGLKETSQIDLATIDALATVVRWLEPAADYRWLVEEAEENLPKELDFKNEAANAQRCARLVKSDSRLRGKVVVPQIDEERTSSRVLTMEYIDGVKITDIQGLAKMGASPSEAARLLSLTFAAMVFKWGDVHADPHAANVFVRKTPSPDDDDAEDQGRRRRIKRWVSSLFYNNNKSPKYQLVLLDHGLYRQLDDKMRIQYASLWRSLVFGDKAGIIKAAQALDAGDTVPMFVSMLTQRPWDEITAPGKTASERLKMNRTVAEKERIQTYASQFAMEITDLLRRIPRPLLLLLKTNDCLRAVDVELGTPVNNVVITARECTAACARERALRHPDIVSRAIIAKETVHLEVRMALLQVMSTIAGWFGLSSS